MILLLLRDGAQLSLGILIGMLFGDFVLLPALQAMRRRRREWE